VDLPGATVDAVNDRPRRKSMRPPLRCAGIEEANCRPCSKPRVPISSTCGGGRAAVGRSARAGPGSLLRTGGHVIRPGVEFQYATWDDESALVVGGTGLHPRPGRGRIEIGYWVRVGWLRQDIAPSGARRSPRLPL
jgi:hypothetical protein